MSRTTPSAASLAAEGVVRDRGLEDLLSDLQLLAPPSPAAHEEVPMQTTPRAAKRTQAARRPLGDREIEDFLNFGSEDEDEEEEQEGQDEEEREIRELLQNMQNEAEEDEPPILYPRRIRLLFPPPEDTPEEAEAAGIVDISSTLEPGVMHMPISLFDFEWRAFPTLPVPSRSRREPFVGISGSLIGPISDPYDVFVLIWDKPIMELVVYQTNLYAQEYAKRLLELGAIGPSSRIASWKDTNVDEMYTYFALLIAMGVIVKSKLEEYWSSNRNIFQTPGFSANMSLKRFQLLSRCLHFSDNSVSLQSLSRSEAKIFKIRPIVDHLNSKFSSLYGLGQNIALDESLTQWKGWLDIKQFIRNKAAGIGVKTYEVCDSSSGYLWRFEVHAGESQSDVQQVVMSGSIPNLVLRMLRGLEHRGHTVWMDNFYNSPALARVLKSIGYDCVGTLRINRQLVPEQVTLLSKSSMRVGQVCGCTSGDVDLMIWRDQNLVAMISTYHGNTVSENKPTVVKDYNVCMGGVDKKDQMLAMYPMERKRTQVWYKKFFRRLLNVSVLNAYILHKDTAQITHRQFRMTLVSGILERHGRQSSEIGMLLPPLLPGVSKFSAEVISHFPNYLPMASGVGRYRRRCFVCKIRTTFQCRACDVALCVNFDDNPSSCFIKYHS